MALSRPPLLLAAPLAPPVARLLWLPALGVPARKYERFAGQLAERGFVVGIHEWRGTGECRLRPRFGVDWGYREWLMEDVPASLEQLRQAFPDGPQLFGGHSIGGQMAVLAAALGQPAAGLVIVGSGIPHWRLFPTLGARAAVGGFGAVLPLLTRLAGHYPGHRLGFAGREAGQLMRDWAGTVRRGHYEGLRGLPDGLHARLAAVDAPALGLRFEGDWLVPADSLDALLATTGSRAIEHRTMDERELGTTPDHFAWMRQPGAVARAVGDWWRTIAPETLSS